MFVIILEFLTFNPQSGSCRLRDFISSCIREANNDTTLSCEVSFTYSVEDVLECIEDSQRTFDLVLTFYGGDKNVALNILRGIKRLQLNEMDEGLQRKVTLNSFISYPSVIVFGMNTTMKERKNQLVRLGALDYCPWSNTSGEALYDEDMHMLAVIYRTFAVDLVDSI